MHSVPKYNNFLYTNIKSKRTLYLETEWYSSRKRAFLLCAVFVMLAERETVARVARHGYSYRYIDTAV